METDKSILFLKSEIEKSLDMFENLGDYTSLDENVIRAIETVLKDREILIEEKDTYKRIDNISNSITMEEFKKTLKEAEKEFISKDEIREKITRLKLKSDKVYNKFLKTNKTNIELHDEGLEIDSQIYILEKLLKDGN